MFNAKEFIDDLVMDGFKREEAIQMAKDELSKRKIVSIRTGQIAENNYQNNIAHPVLNSQQKK